ncbi:MAG: DUF350 domain-containing protein [Pseudomonadota bacterium]
MLQDASIGYYAIDFVIILGFMAALRLLVGAISEVSLTDILSKQDNFAVGITLAGAIVAVAILMMGVVAGEAGRTYVDEITLMAGYGVLAMALMWLTRKVFDHISLPGIAIHEEVMKGNVAAGIVDVGNMIATAIIVRAAMSWVDGSTFLGLAIVVVAYVVSQVILTAATIYRKKVFERRHGSERNLAGEIASGNTALAIRFAGYRLGVGLAVTATSGLVVYDPSLLALSVVAWSLVAMVMFLAQTSLSIALRYILLPGINVGQEVGEQRNVAIGTMEAAIYIGVGFTFVGLLG